MHPTVLADEHETGVCTALASQKISMSSNGTTREESAPHDEVSNSKRRRIAFSCLDCRRRKLKCDRIFPSCGRCQKGGHANACTYDSEAIDTLNQSPGNALQNSRDLLEGGPSKTIARLPSVARSFAEDERDETNMRPQSNTTARLHAQDERIRQLENRIIGLETIISRTHARDSRSMTGGMVTRSDCTLSFDKTAAVAKEPMIFRGKGFKTQFYGASHHTSYLSHVGAGLLFR